MGAMAEASGKSSKFERGNTPSFVITTRDGLISVKANEAPLKDVIERIGQELGIEVDAQIGDEDKVTAEFQDLHLEAALKRLSGNYAYTTDKQGEEITKLFLFAKGENAPSSGTDIRGASSSKTGRRAGSSEPFKFEFDPMKAMDKGE